MDRELLTRLIIPRERDPNAEVIIKEAIRLLPNVPKSDVDLQDSCGVCLTTYEDIFQEVEEYTKNKSSEDSGSGKDMEEEECDENAPGLTKVEFCGHTYCRRDLIGWIRQTPPNNTCPLCRHPFIELPVADDESSDGGEYIPGADDYDDDATDGYSDMDPLAPSEHDELYTMAHEYRRERARARALREEFAQEIAEGEEQERQEELRAEFAQEIADGEENEERERMEADLRAEFAQEMADGEEEERQAELRAEFAQEIAQDEETEERERMEADLRAEFAQEIAESEEERQAELRAEFAQEIADGEEEERMDDLRAEFAAVFEEEEEQERFRSELATIEAEEERQAALDELRAEFGDIIADDEEQENEAAFEERSRQALQEWNSLRDHFAQLDGEDMDLDDVDEEEATVARRDLGSDALMDVYASDSSSDLDYEPEDYLMSDTDTDMSSDFDHSVEELDCLDKEDAIAIHDDSSNDSLLALAATEEEKTPPSTTAATTSNHHTSSSRTRDTN